MQKIVKALILIAILVEISLLTGCTNLDNESVAAYFHRGVYKSYSHENKSSQFYFYVFYDENSGHTEDSKNGIGLPFSCVQTVDNVKFKFAGSEEPEEILKIKSAKKNLITGSFKDNKLLIFIPVSDANPDNFDAVEYIKNRRN